MTFQINNKSKSRFVFAAFIILVIGVAVTVAAVIAIFWWQSLPPQREKAGLICKELATSATRIINSDISGSNNDSKIMLCVGK